MWEIKEIFTDFGGNFCTDFQHRFHHVVQQHDPIIAWSETEAHVHDDGLFMQLGMDLFGEMGIQCARNL